MKIYKVKVNGKTYKVELESIDEVKSVGSKAIAPKENKVEEKKPVSTGDGNLVLAPIQGSVCKVNVKVGDKVKKGDVLLFIEAMKLENEVVSPFDGEVSEVAVSKGQMVTNKQLLVKIK